jgi:hypothetical protein
LEKYNFFWNVRNNSGFLWWCILWSKSHIITIMDDFKYTYKNIWSSYDFNRMNLCISILSINSYAKTNYKPKILSWIETELKSFCEDFWLPFWNCSVIDSLEILSKFYTLKTTKNLIWLYEDNGEWEQFFIDVHAYRKTLKSIFKSFLWSYIDVRKFREIFLSYVPYNHINIYIDQIWAWWDSKIIILNDKSWIIDDELISNINYSMWLNLSLDYSTFYDWYRRKWSKIEQYKSQNIKSKFCNWIEVYKFFDTDLLLLTLEKKEVFAIDPTLVLTYKDKKIYLNWNPLSSKDLKSQNFTVDFIYAIFTNKEKTLSNKNLPKSSYSNNKNELLSKIILPIKNIVKTETWKDINIECNWTNSSFTIEITKSEIPIYLY